MKYLLLASMLVSSPLLAGQQINESISVKDDVSVEIEHGNGKISIVGWDKSEVKVSGELDDRAQKFIFEQRSGRVLIKVKMPRHKNNWNKKLGDDLEIKLPMGSSVRYSGIGADAEISNLSAGLQADTVHGYLDVDGVKGRINLQSVNGNIDARNIDGDIQLETVNGNIQDHNSSGSELILDSINGDIESNSSIKDIRVETVNGGIELTLQEVDKLEMSTVNGTIEASMHLLKGGDVEGSSVSGEIELTMQKDVSARFDLQAHAGGSLVNRLSDHEVRKAKYGPGRWLDFELNGGKAKVDLSTVSGRIKLRAAKD